MLTNNLNTSSLFNPEESSDFQRVLLEERNNFKGEVLVSTHKAYIADTIDSFLPLSSLSQSNFLSLNSDQASPKQIPFPYEVVYLVTETEKVYKLVDQRDDTWLLDGVEIENTCLVSSHYRIRIGKSVVLYVMHTDSEVIKIDPIASIYLRDTSVTSTDLFQDEILFSNETLKIDAIFPIKDEESI